MYNKMDGYHFGIKLTIFSPYDPITKEKKEAPKTLADLKSKN